MHDSKIRPEKTHPLSFIEFKALSVLNGHLNLGFI